MDEVTLHAAWESPFCVRVTWALKLKGIPHQYIEEDIFKKSELLLKYNPVHKKVPVLVHGGKPICESMIIIEYLEEKWPHKYPLLPNDPYQRALARFWVNFVDDKGSAIWKVLVTAGEEQEKAKKESLEMLKTIENEALNLIGEETKLFGGEEVGIIDIAFGWFAHYLEVIEEVAGVKLFEANKFPRLHAWIKSFKQVPLIQENFPDYGELLVNFKDYREKFLQSPLVS